MGVQPEVQDAQLARREGALRRLHHAHGNVRLAAQQVFGPVQQHEPGKPDVGHAWAYLPDVANTIARLLERDADRQPFDVFHFGGHWFDRGVEIADATRRVARVPQAPIRRFPWFAIVLLSPFIETFREMLEMRYLWTTPLQLDNRKLVAFLGEGPHVQRARDLFARQLFELEQRPRNAWRVRRRRRTALNHTSRLRVRPANLALMRRP